MPRMLVVLVATIAVLCAIGVSTAAASVVGGAPPAPGQFVPAPPVKTTNVDPAKSPLPDAVREYAKQYGVERSRAEEILVAQSRGTGLEEELRALLGDGYGGLEFDQEHARFKIWLAPGGERSAVAEELDARHLGDAVFAATRWSAVAREKAVGMLDEKLEGGLRTGGISVASDPERGVTATSYSNTPQQTKSDLTTAAAAIGGVVHAADSPAVAPKLPTAQACVNMYCDPPLIAGLRYGYAITPNLFGGCTTAFSASMGSNNYQLTAGHCVSVPNWPSPGRWNNTCYSNMSSCPWIGQDVGGYAGAAGDAGLMTSSGTWWNWPAVRVIGWSWPTYGTPGTGNATVGMYLCHTGSGISATSCGTVTSLTAAGAWGGSSMVEVSGVCQAPGDSGGPWFDPSTMVAYGIHSAGYSGCPNSSYFEPVTRAAATLGVNVQHV